MADIFTPTPVRGVLDNDSAVQAGNFVGTLSAIVSPVDPTLGAGNLAALSVDTAGRLRVALGDVPFDVDITDRAGRVLGDVAVPGGVNVNNAVALDAATIDALNAGNDTVALDAATIDALNAGNDTVDVTDRAGRVLGVVTLDAPTLAALENIDITDRAGRVLGAVTVPDGVDVTNLPIDPGNGAVLVTSAGGTTDVSGSTVALDAATLTALEDINITDRAGRVLGDVAVPAGVNVNNAVALDAATIDALNAGNDAVDITDRAGRVLGDVAVPGGVNVNNAVALDAATIDALNTGNDTMDVIDRAGRVLGDVAVPAGVNINNAIALDAATLAALEDTAVRNALDAGGAVVPLTVTVTNAATGTQEVSGTVELGAATLGALENIDVTDRAGRVLGDVAVPAGVNVNNAVALDAATIAALNEGNDTVALDAATLAALENIDITDRAGRVLGDVAVPGGVSVNNLPANQDVTVTNAVALDAATLGALENINIDNIVRVSGNATAHAVTNPLFTQLSDGTAVLGTAANPLFVTADPVPGVTVDSGLLTAANVAAGADVTFDSAVIAAGTGRLVEITASASVRLRVELQTVGAGGVAVAQRVFFLDANDMFQYAPATADTITVDGGAGVVFRLVIRNMDNINSANLYASITHSA